MKLAKTSRPGRETRRPTERRTDTPTYCPVSTPPITLEEITATVCVCVCVCVRVCVCVWRRETLTCLLSIFWPRPAADDHCRVRLSVQNANPHSDYINANFVPVRAQCRVVPAAPPVCLSTCLHLLLTVCVCVCVCDEGRRIREGLHLHPGSDA